MFETSKDLLFIAIAASVVGFTVFACYSIFYLAQILRQAFKIVREMRDRIHKVDELIKILKDKLEHSTSYLMLIGEGVKKLVEVAKDYTGKGSKGSKKAEVRSKKK